MKARRARYGLAVVLAALLLAGLGACHDELSPIFYTIEKEQPIADAGLPNEVIVTGLVRLTNGAAEDFYVAAYGPISYRAAPDGDWAALALPPGAAHCTALEVSGGTLYGGFCSSTDASLGVWTADTTSFPDITWSQVGVPAGLQNVDITMIQSVGPEDSEVVFVSTRDGNGFHLYTSAGTLLISNPDADFSDIAYNPNANSGAGAYFAISGERIFQIADPTGSPVVTDLGSPTEVGSVNYFGGIYFAPDIGASGTMYVSTGDGRLVSTTDGTTWDPSSVIKVDSAAVEFRDFIQAGSSPNFHLLVGTRMQGYFDLPDGNPAEAVRSPDFNLAELHNGAIQGFLWDTDHSLLFARTFGAGLWSSDDLGADWARE